MEICFSPLVSGFPVLFLLIEKKSDYFLFVSNLLATYKIKLETGTLLSQQIHEKPKALLYLLYLNRSTNIFAHNKNQAEIIYHM